MQDRRVPLDVFVGRAAEFARVAEVITRVEAGQPWLVAVEGELGMGKTALARRCLARAQRIKVLWARADQAETDLDFGVADQLLRAAGDAFPTVPSTSGGGPAVSSFAVGARLLTAALYLADETQGVALRPAVEAAGPSPLRSYVLGAMVEADGQLGEAEQRYSQALAEARTHPDSQPLAATIAARLAGTYTLRGEGEKTLTLGRWALDTGRLDAAAARQTRTRVAIGASQVAGPREALDELGHLDADPARVDPIDVDGLSWRGIFRLLSGDLGRAVTDMTAGLKMVRQGATLALGQRTYGYLALAQYLAGAWDDALLTAEQGLSAAAIHPYRHELPLFHLAAGCVPAGRGAAEEAERHARLAEEVAASLDYGQERLYAAMARALVCQAAGDYPGMADALQYWRDDAALDGRSRRDATLWRPLLAEGLIGTGQAEQAAAVLARLRADSGQVAYLRPALAWLDGWLAELQGSPEEAQRI